jgi:hypothetical protein
VRSRAGRRRAGRLTSHIGRTAAAHALQRTERHRERPITGEADHLAGNEGGRLDLDVELRPEPHRADRPRHFDEKPAQRRDAAEHFEPSHALERSERGREARLSRVRHGSVPHQRFIYDSD